MGYTHYFGFKGKDKKVARILRWHSVKKLFAELYKKEKLNFVIQFESDIPEKYRFDDVEIFFNGIDDDGHETFYLSRYASRMTGFTFCKTARKPYDVVVCSLLILLKHFYGNDFFLDSDGIDNNGLFNDMWKDALNVVNRNFDFTLQLEYCESRKIQVKKIGGEK